MDQATACPAAACGQTGVVRGRVFGCNIKCLAQEKVQRLRRQTRRKERIVWTDRREGKKVPPLRAERRVTTYSGFRGTEKVRVCILAVRMGLPFARIMRRGGPIRPRRLVDTCRHGTPREPFSRVRPGTMVAARTRRPDPRLSVRRSPHAAPATSQSGRRKFKEIHAQKRGKWAKIIAWLKKNMESPIHG